MHIYKCIYASPVQKQVFCLCTPFAQRETAAVGDKRRLNKIAPLHRGISHSVSQGCLELVPFRGKKASSALLVQVNAVKRRMTSHLLRLQQNLCGVCVSLEVEWFMARWEGSFQRV